MIWRLLLEQYFWITYCSGSIFLHLQQSFTQDVSVNQINSSGLFQLRSHHLCFALSSNIKYLQNCFASPSSLLSCHLHLLPQCMSILFFHYSTLRNIVWVSIQLSQLHVLSCLHFFNSCFHLNSKISVQRFLFYFIFCFICVLFTHVYYTQNDLFWVFLEISILESPEPKEVIFRKCLLLCLLFVRCQLLASKPLNCFNQIHQT